ncbi:Aldo/keto reductase [Tricholoma matsutake]|nr:Aldo/keto reductase [Tricholoma matsutake 945]
MVIINTRSLRSLITTVLVRLGASGLEVSKIILGCINYGSPHWKEWTLPYEEMLKHVKEAYEAGINTFDTAPAQNYSNGHSEIVLGKAIRHLKLPREEIVVMTKHIFDSVKQSLERLQLNYIDVLQCHKFDYDTPISETMQALHDVVQAGYVRYIGMSPCWAYQYYAINNKLTPFISMQTHYSLVYREDERDILPTLKHFGVGAIPKSPLSANILSIPWNQAEVVKREVDQLARKKQITMEQVAIAWVLHKEGVCCTIVNTTQLNSLGDAIGSINLKLSDEELQFLEEKYQPQRPLE